VRPFNLSVAWRSDVVAERALYRTLGLLQIALGFLRGTIGLDAKREPALIS